MKFTIYIKDEPDYYDDQFHGSAILTKEEWPKDDLFHNSLMYEWLIENCLEHGFFVSSITKEIFFCCENDLMAFRLAWT